MSEYRCLNYNPRKLTPTSQSMLIYNMQVSFIIFLTALPIMNIMTLLGDDENK